MAKTLRALGVLGICMLVSACGSSDSGTDLSPTPTEARAGPTTPPLRPPVTQQAGPAVPSNPEAYVSQLRSGTFWAAREKIDGSTDRELLRDGETACQLLARSDPLSDIARVADSIGGAVGAEADIFEAADAHLCPGAASDEVVERIVEGLRAAAIAWRDERFLTAIREGYGSELAGTSDGTIAQLAWGLCGPAGEGVPHEQLESAVVDELGISMPNIFVAAAIANYCPEHALR